MWNRDDLGGVIPLTMVTPGKEVVVKAIRAGRGLQRRLLSIGIVPGETIKVLNNGGRGPFLIQLKGTRIALGYGVAYKIMAK